MRVLFVMSVRVLFWLASRRRRSFLSSRFSLRRVLIVWWRLGHAASLYVLLTGFRASDHPSTRFGTARLREARTACLAAVFACCGVLSCAGGAIAAAISVA